MTPTVAKDLEDAVDGLMTALHETGVEENYFLHSANGMEIVLPSTIGNSRLISYDALSVLTQKMHTAYAEKNPSFLYQHLYYIGYQGRMNSAAWTRSESLTNRMLYDPKAIYSDLRAKTALIVKQQDTAKSSLFQKATWLIKDRPKTKLEQDLWSDFISSSPTMEQLETYGENLKATDETKKFYDSYYAFVKEAMPFSHESIAHCSQHFTTYQTAKDVETGHLKQLYPQTVLDESQQPSYDDKKYQDDFAENFSNVRDKVTDSRDILLQDPVRSLQMLLQKKFGASNNINMLDTALPVLAARIELLSQMKGNFIRNAVNYFDQFMYNVVANIGTCETRPRMDLALWAQQEFVALGERNVDLDIETLKRETAILKNTP